MSTVTNNIAEPTYRAAWSVAPTISSHFVEHIGAARARGEEKLAPTPDGTTIARIIDATFWASLRREEGRSPKISLAFFSPEQVPQPLIFERPLPLTSKVLTKLGPAVERPGVHLGVFYTGVGEAGPGDLYVWGATRKVP